MEQVKKVLVVHKTHLDIGFTAMAKDVLDMYVNQFIPQAIETAYTCNSGGQKNFVWTVASFIIQYYLDYANNPQRLIDAIKDGYIAWHGLACTTHTELMDAELFEYDITIAKELDKRFGKRTIAAKMTDVPCHTHAIVPYMAKNELSYLHIGINEAAAKVQIPTLARLRYGDDEIILNYAGDYGRPEIFGEIALEFAHTADNMGPPTPQKVFAEMERLKKKYPNAVVVSATLDDFANAVLPYREQLPIITSELGDTWIHGASTDPFKSAALMELLRIKDLWKQQDAFAASSARYQEFMRLLLLTCEHTGGMDMKKWLYDFKNWRKDDFLQARLQGNTTIDLVEPAGKDIVEFVLEQTRVYTGGTLCGSYHTIERSWEEQRQYLYDAVELLPHTLQTTAKQHLQQLVPVQRPAEGTATELRSFSIAGYNLRILADGSLELLQDRQGRHYANAYLGRLVYSVFGSATVDACFHSYNRNIETTRVWSEPDNAKPGLYAVSELQDQSFCYAVSDVFAGNDSLTICLAADETAAKSYGAPRRAEITYSFGVRIGITLSWYDKSMNRMPEATYFGFNLGFKDPGKLTVTKLGLPVYPYDVCPGGNRKLHACTEAQYENICIRNFHSPLLSVGGCHLYDTEDDYGKLENGLYYLLHNNRWNTNFPLWYGDNASFQYSIDIE